jgi:DNA invertase Pin-like site-specific DNA recombinase
MKKLFLVARVSTRRQMIEGQSVHLQVEQLKKFAKDNGAEEIKIFEIQVSGAKQLINIGQLASIIKQAKEEGADLAVTKADRLSRDTISLLMLKKASEENGVEIHITSMKRKISEISDLEWNLMSFMASEERKLIRARTKEACKERVGTFGTSLSAKKMNQKGLQKRVELAQAWARSTKLRQHISEAVSALKKPNLSSVARWLNGEGLVTRRGSKWSPANLSQQVGRLGWNWKQMTKV